MVCGLAALLVAAGGVSVPLCGTSQHASELRLRIEALPPAVWSGCMPTLGCWLHGGDGEPRPCGSGYTGSGHVWVVRTGGDITLTTRQRRTLSILSLGGGARALPSRSFAARIIDHALSRRGGDCGAPACGCCSARSWRPRRRSSSHISLAKAHAGSEEHLARHSGRRRSASGARQSRTRGQLCPLPLASPLLVVVLGGVAAAGAGANSRRQWRADDAAFATRSASGQRPCADGHAPARRRYRGGAGAAD